jgi:hypothetical protein
VAGYVRLYTKGTLNYWCAALESYDALLSAWTGGVAFCPYLTIFGERAVARLADVSNIALVTHDSARRRAAYDDFIREREQRRDREY